MPTYNINKNSTTYGTVNQSAATQQISLKAYISTDDTNVEEQELFIAWGYSPEPSSYSSREYNTDYVSPPPNTLWEFDYSINVACDDKFYWKVKGWFTRDGQTETINLGYSDGATEFHSYAVDPTMSQPSPGSQTATTITLSNISWTPGTKDSNATLHIRYKPTGGSWTTWGSYIDSASGNTNRNVSNTVVTGLTPETQYQFRLRVYRPETSNPTDVYDGTESFLLTTLADTPTVTTDNYSNLGQTTVTLAATVDYNGNPGTVGWRYLDEDDPAYPVATPNDTDGTVIGPFGEIPNVGGDGTWTADVTGLTSEKTHQYWATYTYGGAWPFGAYTIFGDIRTFTTTPSPEDQAQDEARMQVYEYTRTYGVVLTGKLLFFTLQTPSGTNSNTFVVGTSFAAGDVKISKDGGTFNNIATLPSTWGNGYTITLSATEMEANEIDIVIKDQDGPAFRDAHLRVITHREYGTFLVDAKSGTKGTNTDAMELKGFGTGAGLRAESGDTVGAIDIEGKLQSLSRDAGLAQAGTSSSIRLATSSSATADEYNGDIVLIVGGTGAGQGRTITDFDTSRNATVSPNFLTTPDTTSEYIVMPGLNVWDQVEGTAPANSDWSQNQSFRRILQFIKRRLFNKATQTATTQIIRDDVDGANLLSRAVSDNSTTQTQEEVS
jgi:hypothetical protein